MAQPFEVDELRAEDLVDAVQKNDKDAVKKIFEEVGSCGWESLVNKTDKLFAREKINSSMLVFPYADKGLLSLQVEVTNYGSLYDYEHPLTTVVDKPCR